MPASNTFLIPSSLKVGSSSAKTPPVPENQDRMIHSDKICTPSTIDSEAYASPLETTASGGVNPIEPDDPEYKELKLSGRIINALTMLPNRIHLSKNNDGSLDYHLTHVRGNSSVYSSYYYLLQQTSWETHLVAWTGEIDVEKNRNFYYDSSSTSKTINNANIDSSDLVAQLTGDDKTKITQMIKQHNNSENIYPIWLLDGFSSETDSGKPIKGSSSLNVSASSSTSGSGSAVGSRWRKYAENVLWPVFHYVTPMPNYSSAVDSQDLWWQDYVKLNEAYANRIESIYKDGDIIWIHDYNLLLLPALLRLKLPNCYIALFMHTPFPSLEYFRCLLRRSDLLEGMLGANKISFQSFSFVKHFLSSCTRILGCENNTPTSVTAYGNVTKLEAIPNGIDTALVIHDAFSDPKIDEKVLAIKEIYNGKKIIVARDRMDPVRGLVPKLEAFAKFLQLYPQWHDKVVLIQVSSPVESSTASKDYERQVAELVAYINGNYGTLHSTPVQHYQMRIDKEEYLALLRVADLALITTIRDGMNTTALEFVACQQDNSSPLILSEFSGTTTLLQDAIIVNPWDIFGVARSINDCLLMPQDSKNVIESKLLEVVKKHTVQYSSNLFLRHFIEDLSTNHESHVTPLLDVAVLLKKYQNSERRLFLFDYDGTLTPIVQDPDAAIPSLRMIDLMKRLAGDPKNEIWIISGRDRNFLQKWLGDRIPKLGLSAEHGCFVKTCANLDNNKTETNKWFNLTENCDMSWQKDVEEIFEYYTERTPGSFIEKKSVALTWHYRKADPEYGIFQAKELKQHLLTTVATNYDVEVMSGKANIEVRPTFVNKGEIVKRLVLGRYGSCRDLASFVDDPFTKMEKMNDENTEEGMADTQKLKNRHNNNVGVFESKTLPDFVFCVGDDKTDEDMFEALITIDDKLNCSNSHSSNGECKKKEKFMNIYPVTVGLASKKTIALSHLLDPKQVVDTIGLLVGEISMFNNIGSVELNDRGEPVKIND